MRFEQGGVPPVEEFLNHEAEQAQPPDLLHEYEATELNLFGHQASLRDLYDMCPVDKNDPRMTPEAINTFVVNALNEAGAEIKAEHWQYFNHELSERGMEIKVTVTTEEKPDQITNLTEESEPDRDEQQEKEQQSLTSHVEDNDAAITNIAVPHQEIALQRRVYIQSVEEDQENAIAAEHDIQRRTHEVLVVENVEEREPVAEHVVSAQVSSPEVAEPDGSSLKEAPIRVIASEEKTETALEPIHQVEVEAPPADVANSNTSKEYEVPTDSVRTDDDSFPARLVEMFAGSFKDVQTNEPDIIDSDALETADFTSGAGDMDLQAFEAATDEYFIDEHVENPAATAEGESEHTYDESILPAPELFEEGIFTGVGLVEAGPEDAEAKPFIEHVREYVEQVSYSNEMYAEEAPAVLEVIEAVTEQIRTLQEAEDVDEVAVEALTQQLEVCVRRLLICLDQEPSEENIAEFMEALIANTYYVPAAKPEPPLAAYNEGTHERKAPDWWNVSLADDELPFYTVLGQLVISASSAHV
jgi:hypothetical protein